MPKLMEVEKQILIGTGIVNLGDLIHQKGFYLRQLAYSVMCGSYSLDTASRLLKNY